MLLHTLLQRRQSSWLELFQQRLLPTSILSTRLHFSLFIPLLFVSIVTSSGTSGCGCNLPVNQSPGGPSVQVPIQQSSSLNRTYLIHIPVTYNKNTATPLIFSFHGRDRNSSYQEKLTGFSRPDWNPNAIVIYPQGINNTWQGDPDSVNINDKEFVSDMITTLSKTYCLDDKRIYAAGKSNGGGFTNLLACDPQLSTQIAAFAPVSAAIYIPGVKSTDCVGTIPQTLNFPCTPGRKNVPILEFHGLQDQVISYRGGPRRSACLISISHWLDEWADMEGYGSATARTSLFDGNVEKLEYAPDTENQGIITEYAINNWDHDWPSTTPTVDSNN
ncbi:hypothetical protein EPUL_005051, partial [Erysiphe pulchra]